MNTENNKSNKSSIICILVGAVFLAAAAYIFFLGPNLTHAQVDLTEYSSIRSICELATLKSFYHNVAVYEESPSAGTKMMADFLLWPFNEMVKPWYKQLWFEYSGIVETGIDASQIQIHNPDSNGVVEIYVPDAKVLNVYADENSLSEPITETGWFTQISAKDKTLAFSEAQKAMRQEAENDTSLLLRAKNNAKILLEQFILNTGKEIGAKYTINWIDSPK